MKKVMTREEFAVAMFEAETDYADVSAFYHSARRTGHRWQVEGPSNQSARMMQVICALGLSLDDVRVLIAHGTRLSGSAVPKKVVSLETQLAAIRRAERQHDPNNPALMPPNAPAWSPSDIEKAAQAAALTGKTKGRARAARGGKGASHDRRKSKDRTPQKGEPATGTV